MSEKELPVIVWGSKPYKGTMVWDLCEIDEIQKFKVRDDDLFVTSFPRSGTTLTQELTYLICTGDFEKAKTVHLDDRCPYIDLTDTRFPCYNGVNLLKNQPGPRFMKTHLNHDLLPTDFLNGKGKAVYVYRNPKDSFLSFYKLGKYLKFFSEDAQSFADFFESMMKGTLIFGPWGKHVREYWNHRNDENLIFLKYEDIVRDKPAAIRKLAQFLGKDITEDQVQRIADHCDINNMKGSSTVGYHYHTTVRALDYSYPGLVDKGIVGRWKEAYTDEMSKRVDEMIERELEGTGIHFD